MRRFCPVCGKDTERLIDSLCQECFCREKDLLKLPKEIEIKVCGKCLRYFSGGRWVELGLDLEELLKSASEREVDQAVAVEGLEECKTKIHAEEVKQKGRGTFHVRCTVGVEGKVEEIKYAKRKEILVRAKVAQCEDCSRATGGYFEAILQVRGEGLDGEDKEGLLELAESEVGGMAGERTFISKSKVLRNGVDVYIGSLNAARKVAADMRKKFGGRVKESPKLVGRSKGGRGLYRVNVLLRLPLLRPGEEIHFEGKELVVERMGGNLAICREKKSGKRVSVPLRAFERKRNRK